VRPLFAAWLLPALVGLFAALAAPRVATAQSRDRVAQARAHNDQAEAYMRAGRFDRAAEEYLAAFERVSRPGFLFNAALAFEKLGDKSRAVALFERALASGATGNVATEARARKAALESQLDNEAEARRQREAAAAAEAKRQAEIAARLQDGKTKLSSGDAAGALAAFRAAYDLAGDPELLFDIADACQAAGERKQALAFYHRYRAESKTGSHLGDAVERIAVLEREIATTAGGVKADGPPAPAPATESKPVPARPRRAHRPTVPPAALSKPREQAPPPSSRGHRWAALALGVAMIAGGVALDVIPGSAGNDKVDALDFAPIGLYLAGGIAVLTF